MAIVRFCMVSGVRAGWQCRDCKVCQVCRTIGDESKLMSCEQCDKAYHAMCLRPIVTSVPKYGWKCKVGASVSSSIQTCQESLLIFQFVMSSNESVAVLSYLRRLWIADSWRGPIVTLARTLHRVRLVLPAAEQGFLVPVVR